MFGERETQWLRQQLDECQNDRINTLKSFIECHKILVEYQKLGSIEYLKKLVKKDKESKNG